MFSCRVTLLNKAMFLLLACVLTFTLVMLVFMDGLRRTAMFYNSSGFVTALKANSSSTLLEHDFSCQPFRHIYFLKPHKTASTTIANILYRYGDKRNLTFVIPTEARSISFSWPQRFQLSNAYPLYKEPNILCNHARYNKPLINWLLPRPKAKYITIIRNPVGHFESAFNFYRFEEKLNLQNEIDPIKVFLDSSPRSFKHVWETSGGGWNFPLLYRVTNPNLFDLGLDHKYFLNRTAVQNYIEFIDREFDLVMIADHFDESLILLKQMFCWEFEDIVYIKQRVGERRKNTLQKDVKRKILAWNWADRLLFNHFNKTLWKKIRLAGPGFHRDLERFRKLNWFYQHTCPLIMNFRSTSQEHRELLHKCTQMDQSERKFYTYIVKKYMQKTVSDIDTGADTGIFGREGPSSYESKWRLFTRHSRVRGRLGMGSLGGIPHGHF